jgi:hypothetical protein
MNAVLDSGVARDGDFSPNLDAQSLLKNYISDYVSPSSISLGTSVVYNHSLNISSVGAVPAVAESP